MNVFPPSVITVSVTKLTTWYWQLITYLSKQQKKRGDVWEHEKERVNHAMIDIKMKGKLTQKFSRNNAIL